MKALPSSGGNAGYAVAYAGRMLATPVTVVVPATTSERAKSLIRSEGAEVIVHGASWMEANARALLAQPGQTPSARVLAQMAQAHDNSFTAFTLSQSSQAREALLELPWSAEQQARHAALAAQSLVSQKAIEDSDTQPFEEWRQQYMAAQGLG